jgi:hypothetical protein
MSAKSISSYRRPCSRALLGQVEQARVDAKAGEFFLPFRGKIRNTPTDRADLQITNVSLFYEVNRDDGMTNHETRENIIRPLHRRISRKLAA